jgi:hypothetical protein
VPNTASGSDIDASLKTAKGLSTQSQILRKDIPSIGLIKSGKKKRHERKRKYKTKHGV